MKTELMTKMSGIVRKAGFKLQKTSPEILIVVGIVGAVAGGVLACKATMKVNDILDDAKDELDKIHECAEDPKYADKYTADDAKKDTAIVYAKTGLKFVRLYAPSIALFTVSMTGIVASHVILKKRNVALAAAFTTVNESFKAYRGRVKERFGDEVERQLKLGTKVMEIEEQVVDDNGREQTVKKTVDVRDSASSRHSEFARFFDESSAYWEKDSEYNLMFLNRMQDWANNRLRANGRLFLNEVYEALGIPTTKAGQVVGWVYDPKCPIGDNYVDFGIYDIYNESSRDFVNGYERSILLDFNVDGNIWEMM